MSSTCIRFLFTCTRISAWQRASSPGAAPPLSRQLEGGSTLREYQQWWEAGGVKDLSWLKSGFPPKKPFQKSVGAELSERGEGGAGVEAGNLESHDYDHDYDDDELANYRFHGPPASPCHLLQRCCFHDEEAMMMTTMMMVMMMITRERILSSPRLTKQARITEVYLHPKILRSRWSITSQLQRWHLLRPQS